MEKWQEEIAEAKFSGKILNFNKLIVKYKLEHQKLDEFLEEGNMDICNKCYDIYNINWGALTRATNSLTYCDKCVKQLKKLRSVVQFKDGSFVNFKQGIGAWIFKFNIWDGYNIDDISDTLDRLLEDKGFWGCAMNTKYQCLSITKSGIVLLRADFDYEVDESDWVGFE